MNEGNVGHQVILKWKWRNRVTQIQIVGREDAGRMKKKKTSIKCDNNV